MGALQRRKEITKQDTQVQACVLVVIANNASSYIWIRIYPERWRVTGPQKPRQPAESSASGANACLVSLFYAL